MKIKHIFAAISLAPLGLADSTSPHSWCGIEAPSEQTSKDLDSLRAFEIASRPSIWIQQQNINIPIHLHGVLDPEADSESITAESLRAQLDVMNQAYGPYGIQFTLLTMDRVTDSRLANFNTSFFRDPEADQYRLNYLKTTRKGDYSELNIWLYTSLGDGLNGVCTLPQANYPVEELWRDGCHVAAGTMPGGDRERYNVGFTAVHETGHWLGLLHPWGGGDGDCDGAGDGVDDTPPQSMPVFGCPATQQNSCPDRTGVDSADNYMDYADDTCYDAQKFTVGQQIRMHSSYTQLRSLRR
ncbi:hypothetical protein DL764_001557 [Monosporascus ibericus]|uniref:Peptidase M43 pregnancy-associated plasma-A domain-containing protein n=1 Tax=Monosporascus ibericus TaxID=155417 RepID=A0A4Q4TNV9_9PEZI|nr:hypothetical protein DL764_001557 [Monosporascus ibericus]